ncbi:MAG TPA: winged helix-turn-helix transcriptional regulator [Clostridiaceae bacterium]|jgi:ArsR family transcriptional regulator|nr:winged helix-turn-helix transcriptional regulator [Clostridiaceae bacterium]
MNPIDIALICKSLGDANRLQIMQILADGEKCACELLEAFDITQPTLSYHMKNLTESGLVEVRKDGKWSHYSISCETLQAFKTFVSGLYCTKHSGDCACR